MSCKPWQEESEDRSLSTLSQLLRTQGQVFYSVHTLEINTQVNINKLRSSRLLNERVQSHFKVTGNSLDLPGCEEFNKHDFFPVNFRTKTPISEFDDIRADSKRYK